jgi:hypothetical protein
VAAAALLHPRPEAFPAAALAVLAALFVLVEVGQFMSQILAEQLRRKGGIAGPPAGGTLRSFLNLPTDAGVTCWIFLLWGVPALFLPAYAILLAALAAISAVSMRRKYLGLTARPADTAPDADAVGALPTDRSTRHVR